MTTINFAHANGFPAPSYQTFFSALNAHITSPINIIAKHQYAHDPQYPIVNNWEHQVSELIDYIKLTASEPVIGIGHSFGAVITYLAACRDPELFKAVVLCDPPLITGIGGSMFEGLKIFGLMDHVTPAKRTKQRKQRWDLGEDISQYFSHKSLFKNFDPQCIQDYVTSATQIVGDVQQLTYNVDVEVGIFRTIPTNLHKYYGQCKVPGLLLTGTHTNVTLPVFVKPFIKGNPSIEQATVSGGHLFVFEEPELTAVQISEFIQRFD